MLSLLNKIQLNCPIKQFFIGYLLIILTLLWTIFVLKYVKLYCSYSDIAFNNLFLFFSSPLFFLPISLFFFLQFTISIVSPTILFLSSSSPNYSILTLFIKIKILFCLWCFFVWTRLWWFLIDTETNNLIERETEIKWRYKKTKSRKKKDKGIN